VAEISNELKLSGMEELLHLFDNLHDGVVVVDADMQMTRVNQSFAEMFGYEVNELKGQPLTMLIPETYRKLHNGQAKAFMEHPKARDMQPLARLHGLTKTGGDLPVSISLNPLKSRGGASVLAIVRDMRDWEKLESKMLAAKKMEAIATMAAGVAHNFNNVITSIMGNVALARMEAVDEKQEEYLDAVEGLSLHASAIVKQLLDYAKETQKHDREFSFTQLVSNTLRACSTEVPEGTEVSLELPHAEISYIGDPHLLQQVLHNLLRNAFQAVENTARKRIEVEVVLKPRSECRFNYNCGLCLADGLQVSVTDTGVGIPQEMLGKIFDPFVTTKGNKGTGLGLSMSLGAIKAHHGDIHVESQLGEGTRVTICLPRA